MNTLPPIKPTWFAAMDPHPEYSDWDKRDGLPHFEWVQEAVADVRTRMTDGGEQ